MQIVVLLKQVLDNTKMRFNAATGQPEGGPGMLNPYDEYALETALRLKDAAGDTASVTVLSLGDASVKETLKKAVAAGADAAHHLDDPAFAGGDSGANAAVLAAAIQKLVPTYEVIVMGQMALDTADAQTGPRLAWLLGIPCLTFCKSATVSGQVLTALRETEVGSEVHEMDLPGLLCTIKCDYELRSSNIKGVMKANKTAIPTHAAADLGLETSTVGQAGSHTRINRLFEKPPKPPGRKIDGTNVPEAVNQLVGYLQDEAKVL